MNHNIPEGAFELLLALQMHGHQAYVVGGCVRDMLMGREPNDWDICTSATPEEMKVVFRDYKIIETGLQHGTLTVVSCGDSYEITTFRVDGEYSDGRHPDHVSFTADLDLDLSRRDFTINAIAMSSSGVIRDPFGGADDIKNRIIRCVGSPDRRFSEDALRIMRAVRFASTLEFDIEYNTAMAMMKHCCGLTSISEERITSELRKTLTGRAPGTVLNKYAPILWAFWPEVMPCVGLNQNNPYHIYDVWTHITTALNYGAEISEDLVMRLALLLHDIAKPQCMTTDERGGHFYGHPPVCASVADCMLRRLKFDNATREAVVELIRYHDDAIAPTASVVRRWLGKIGEVQLRRLLAIQIADGKAHNQVNIGTRVLEREAAITVLDKIVEEDQCFSLKKLAVKGDDVMRIGIPEGPAIGQILDRLLTLVVDGTAPNDRQHLLNLLTQIGGMRADD